MTAASPPDPTGGVADAAVADANDALALLVLDPAARGLVVGAGIRSCHLLELRERDEQERERIAAADGVLSAWRDEGDRSAPQAAPIGRGGQMVGRTLQVGVEVGVHLGRAGRLAVPLLVIAKGLEDVHRLAVEVAD
jgi:hypothetical protein